MYSHTMEYWQDEMKRLDLHLYISMMEMGNDVPQEMDTLKGLVLTEQEILSLFQEKPQKVSGEIKGLRKQLHRWETSIAHKLEQSEKHGKVLPLPYLCRRFGLTRFEADAIVLCTAMHLDRKYEKLYAYLQDDITCKYPSVDLAIKLFCHTEKDKAAARAILLCNLDPFLLQIVQRENAGSGLTAKEIRMNERLLPFLLGYGTTPQGLADYIHYEATHRADGEKLISGIEAYSRFSVYASRFFRQERLLHDPSVIILNGRRGAGKKTWVRLLCTENGFPLLIVDAVRMAEAEKGLAEKLLDLFGEGKLQQAAIAFERIEDWIDTEQVDQEQTDKRQTEKEIAVRIAMLTEHLKSYPWPVFLLVKRKWTPPMELRGFVVEVPDPDGEERMRLWEHYGKRFPYSGDADWTFVGNQFQFTPGQIKSALNSAFSLAEWKGGEEPAIDNESLMQACYGQVRHRLTDLAKRVNPLYRWDDLVLLPEAKNQLRQACNQVRYRQLVFEKWGFEQKLSYGKGLSMLFYGPPGTGKTMAAEVIASELNLEMYKIDLSQLVSKYIGETEKNFKVIFDEAQMSHAILFFDEMDALFGKRSEVKDSHDKYANMEVAYLLQKIEEYEGIAILSTNFMQNIDEAFIRRIRFIVKFPFPDRTYREQIWRKVFPKQAPLADTVDFEYLASTFEMTGSQIKNVAVNAAFLAADAGEAIHMKHIFQAVKQEWTKTGKIILKNDLGEYADDFI